jgi:ABC-type nickel/cobalt efflux system permease component RcnA
MISLLTTIIITNAQIAKDSIKIDTSKSFQHIRIEQREMNEELMNQLDMLKKKINEMKDTLDI